MDHDSLLQEIPVSSCQSYLMSLISLELDDSCCQYLSKFSLERYLLSFIQ